MRPGQQNKRGRGRNNNNNNNNGRKGGSPLSRTYDSNGPDMKIRGTAQHIAEKYSALARDAQGSSDNVMAENYLQHAEHYNRIIAAAQAQMQERQERESNDRDSNDRDAGDRNSGDRDQSDRNQSDQPDRQAAHRGNSPERANGHDRDRANGGEREDGSQGISNRQPHEQHAVNGSGPQPEIEGTPAEIAVDEEAAGGEGRGASRRRGAATRPRRQPRAVEAREATADDSGEANGEKKPKRTRRAKSEPKAENAEASKSEQGEDASSRAAAAVSE